MKAESSFGNPGVLVEKFIVNPHHIEVQIIADKKETFITAMKENVLFKEDIKKLLKKLHLHLLG